MDNNLRLNALINVIFKYKRDSSILRMWYGKQYMKQTTRYHLGKRLLRSMGIQAGFVESACTLELSIFQEFLVAQWFCDSCITNGKEFNLVNDIRHIIAIKHIETTIQELEIDI